MAGKQVEFSNWRSEQLSIVYLTRRSDLRVGQQKDGYGPELFVTILEEGQDVGRYVGIEARGVSTNAVRRHGEESVEITRLSFKYTPYQDVPFPACLFVFSMEDDRGYWKWIREPVLESPRGRTLVLNESKTMLPLTNEAIEHLVQTVRCWYEQKQ